MCKEDVIDFAILIVCKTGGKHFKSVQQAAANVVCSVIVDIYIINSQQMWREGILSNYCTTSPNNPVSADIISKKRWIFFSGKNILLIFTAFIALLCAFWYCSLLLSPLNHCLCLLCTISAGLGSLTSLHANLFLNISIYLYNAMI